MKKIRYVAVVLVVLIIEMRKTGGLQIWGAVELGSYRFLGTIIVGSGRIEDSYRFGRLYIWETVDLGEL